MTIKISAEEKISELNNQFQHYFTFLKLVFFNKKRNIKTGFSINDITPQNAKLKEVTGSIKEGEIQIDPNTKVQQLEKLIETNFNLPTQVFRKSNYGWIEINSSDKLSLREVNNIGRDSCASLNHTDDFQQE